jgi:predicted nucleic acid-binding protein
LIVVSDTSPLTYLYQIGRFTLLSSLHGEVIIPPAVEHELRQAGLLHESLDWSVLRVVEPRSLDKVAALCASVDRGESEAIVVASEIEAEPPVDR